jgi:hypothetical protein
MRRLIIAVLAATLFFVGHQTAQTALAVAYAPGWNLVSGPQGSTLTGATGNIYTLQPGDTDYESFAASSPLHGGWGYWAFFPNGGSITFGASAPSLTITPVPGAFLMLGNPSQSVATITGADSVLLYTPAGGYQDSTVIPPGQGAWVTGSGQIALSAAADSAPVAAGPAPAVAPAPAPAAPVQQPSTPFTLQQLRAAALQQNDLPGYTFQQESIPNPPLVGFSQFWADENPSSSRYVVYDSLLTFPSVSIAAG